MSKDCELLRKPERDLEAFRANVLAAVGGDDHPVAVGTTGQHRQNGEKVQEEILRMIQRIFLTNAPSVPQAVVFSAVEHGNGCSWICARVGEALAALGEGNVCLVDANLYSPMLNQYFGVGGGNGLGEAMVQDGPVQNFVRSIRGTNLWLLSGSKYHSDFAGMLNRDRLRARIAELRSQFAFVLLDTPPIGRCLHSLLFGQMADGMILVIEANSTRRDAACWAKAQMEAANVRILGAILNKRTFPIPQTLYRRI